MPRVLRNMKIETRLENWQILEKWTEIVGEKVAQHSKAVGVDTENVFVEVDTPVWQSQLFLIKETIIKKIKKYNTNIRDIKFKIAEQ